MAADEDVLDCDLLLPRSAEDMAGMLDDAARVEIATAALAQEKDKAIRTLLAAAAK